MVFSLWQVPSPKQKGCFDSPCQDQFSHYQIEVFLAKQNQQEQLAIYLNNPIQKQISSLEIRMALLLAEKHLSMNVGHEFIQILNKEIPNNPVLSKLTLGRTKATNIITKGNSVHTP